MNGLERDARQIIGQMSQDDRKDIFEAGTIEGWENGLSMMGYGPLVIAEVERIIIGGGAK